MKKQFIKTPDKGDGYGKMMWCAQLAEAISGDTVSKKAILDSAEEMKIELSDTQLEEINQNFK